MQLRLHVSRFLRPRGKWGPVRHGNFSRGRATPENVSLHVAERENGAGRTGFFDNHKRILRAFLRFTPANRMIFSPAIIIVPDEQAEKEVERS